ncbi:MAG: hypothetical protein ABI305_05850 [Tepidiformaceae bacterium]
MSGAIDAVLLAVRKAVEDALASASESYSGAAPALRLVTALAEGTDRIAASAALKLGYELQAILPFERQEYARDFGAPGESVAVLNSLASFEQLLASPQTTAILELDGVLLLAHAADIGTADLVRGAAELNSAHINVADATSPYEALGEVLVRQCDLLLAVWDGERGRGPGGTANIIRDARARGLPVIIIDSNAPARISFISNGMERPYAEEELREVLFALLHPPRGLGSVPLSTYLSERQPGWNLRGKRLPVIGSRSLLNWVWPAFRTILAPSKRRASRLAAASVPKGATDAEPETGARANSLLQPHFAWADSLATYYGDRYRSAFVVIYGLGVVTVALGVVGLSHGSAVHLGRLDLRLWVTLSLLMVIVGIWYVGGFVKHWHRRWLDYRILAEYLRQIGYLAPLGSISPHVRTPPHRSSGDPGNSWMAWQARAITRELGLTSACFDITFLEAAQTAMCRAWLDSQASYHRETARRSQRMEHLLHWAGLALFAVAFVTTAGAIYRELEVFTAVEAIFPAFGSALAAIRGQAELERLARRSEGIAEWLEEMSEKLALFNPHPGTSASHALRVTAESAANVMLDEVLDWRVVLEIRPLELPA